MRTRGPTPVTGLDYLRAREYDPATGQFLEVDPAVDATRQPYAYVGNDPVGSADPTGLCVGMDGTPQDRACTSNDFFWAGLGPAVGAGLVQGLSNVGSIFTGVGAAAIDISTPCLAHDMIQSVGGKQTDCYQDFANVLSGGAACNIENNGFFVFGNIWGNVAIGALVGEASALAKGAGALSKSASVASAAETTGAETADHIALGLRVQGLEATAAKVEARTLLNDPAWQTTLQRAVADPSSKFAVSLDGMSGSSTYSQVMSAAQRGAAGSGSYTDWEMAQLFSGGRLPGATFLRGGSVVANPFG